MEKYKENHDYSHFHFISPHDRLYRDCMKNIDWDYKQTIETEAKAYEKVISALAFIAVLFMLYVVGLLIAN